MTGNIVFLTEKQPLRESVVQGKMNERGNYGAHLLDVDD